MELSVCTISTYAIDYPPGWKGDFLMKMICRHKLRICAFIVLYNSPLCPMYLLCQDILNVIQLKEALLEDTVHTYLCFNVFRAVVDSDCQHALCWGGKS